MGNYDINVNLNFADAVNTQSLNASIDKITDAINQFKNAINSKRGTSGGGSSTNAFTQYAKDAEDAARRIQLVRIGLVNAQKELVKAMSLPNNGVEATKWLNQVEVLKKELTKLTEQQNNLSKVNPFANYAQSTEEAKLRIKQLYEYINNIKNSINANVGDKTFIATAEQQIKQAQLEIRKLKTQLTEFQAISGRQPGSTFFVRYSKDANDAGIRIAKAKQLIAELQSQANQLQNKGLLSNVEQQRLNAMPERISRVQKAVTQLQQQQRNYNAVLDETNAKGTSAFGNLFKGAFSLRSAFGSLMGVLGIGGGFYALFQGLKTAITTIADFDLAMKKLQSITGASKKDMADLSNSAIAIGGASIFGAKGVGELQIELAKMGFAKNDILDMQQAIVNLATATQEDLASSAEVVANVIRSYHLSATEATRVTDIMGKAFNDSALDLANFREAIKYVAPVAASANFKFEETVSLLEALSNAGIKGSLAGTGLTNIISRLGNENSKFVKTIGHTVNGFDEFAEALIELRKQGADLSDTFQLVDRRAAAVFSILLSGVDTVKEFKDRLSEASGVMEQQAAVQMESITYQAKQAKSAFESLMLSIDSGNSSLSIFIKNVLGLTTATINSLSGINTAINLLDIQKLEKLAYELGIQLPKSFQEAQDRMKESTEVSITDWAMRVITASLGMKSVNLTKAFQKHIKDGITEGNKVVNDEIEKQAQTAIDALRTKYDTAFKKNKKGIYDKEFILYSDAFIRKVPDLMAAIAQTKNKIEDVGSAEYLRLDKEYTLLNKIYEANKKGLDLGSNKGENVKSLREQLELQKEIALANIKLTETGFQRELDLKKEAYKWDVIIAKATISDAEQKYLTLELLEKNYLNSIKDLRQQQVDAITKINSENIKNIQNLLPKTEQTPIDILTADDIKLTNEYAKQISDLEDNYANILLIDSAINDEEERRNRLLEDQKLLIDAEAMALEAMGVKNQKAIKDFADKELKQLNKSLSEVTIKVIPEIRGENGEIIQEKQVITYDVEIDAKQALSDLERFIDTYKRYSDWATANPVMDIIMGDKVKEDIFAGILDEKKLSGLTQLWTESLGKIGDSFKGIADAWVFATDKILSNYDRLISETQNQLQIELQLNQQGFASNVTYEQKKLDNLFESRKKAAEDYKKAVQAQMALDSAATVVSLSLAWADYIKNYAKYPFVGVALAAASIASAFAMFQKFRASAKEASTRYEEGGLLTGKRHSQGGIKIKELNAEVEGGEYVINRKSTIKYRPLIEAINKDDKVFLNKVYLNGLTKSAVQVSVNLDESKELVAIRKLLQGSGISVEYRGNYRIERTGNVERRIRLN